MESNKRKGLSQVRVVQGSLSLPKDIVTGPEPRSGKWYLQMILRIVFVLCVDYFYSNPLPKLIYRTKYIEMIPDLIIKKCMNVSTFTIIFNSESVVPRFLNKVTFHSNESFHKEKCGCPYRHIMEAHESESSDESGS